ncbi:hypothetical protein BV898_15820 [Hypsibius exemplaris]|uniref:Peptidase S1 domain-containing protein n=1 Tax=Hypsibius exemplaris TaxID=2072580 RepID=A0A9X6RKK9_HYPEX|nr:hypothetical protein BV898_15820 [Hypsibius exemplaris]
MAHEKYTSNLPGASPLRSNNDLALLTLDHDIDFAKSPCACRLCLQDLVSDLNSKCIAHGLGDQEVNKFPLTTLRYARLDVKDQNTAECAVSVGPANNPNLFVCAGRLKLETETCQGDSDGPLACLNAKGRFCSAGITSFGFTTCPKERPAYFTRTQAFLDWIRDHADSSDTLSFSKQLALAIRSYVYANISGHIQP